MPSTYPTTPDPITPPSWSDVLGQPARTAPAYLTDVTDSVKAVQTALGTTSAAGTLPLVRKGDLVVHAKDYATLADAVAVVASAGGTVLLSRGTYAVTGDLTISAGSVCLQGEGEGSHIAFTNGGLVIDGQSTYRLRNTLRGLRVSRAGTSGPAIALLGGGATSGVARFNLTDVHVSASTGPALRIAGSYTGTVVGCYFRGSTVGLDVAADPVAGTVFGNLLTFVGGEIQGNAVGATIDSPAGVNFFGVGIEGNTTSGVEIVKNPRSVGFYGCYFESNGTAGSGWDVKLGTSTPTGYGLVMNGCYITNGSSAKTASVILIRGHAVAIEHCTFLQYGANSPVSVQEAAAGNVRGYARNNGTNGSVGIVSLGGATLFGGSYLGDDSSAPVKRHLTGSASLDFPSLVAGASSTLTMTVTGAATGDDATVHANSLPEAGLVFGATVTATDTVTVRCTNVSTGTIDPAARTFRVRVWR